MPSVQAARRRNAAATREAILKSARKAFARSGYDGAGVREIAEAAGVTAMLVNRYFGSKEKLFAEVVANTMSGETIINADIAKLPNLGGYLADGVLQTTRPGAPPLDGSLIMIRSSSSQRAAEIGKREIERRHQKNLSAALDGEDAEARAALILSLIAGVQFMRQMVKLSALADVDSAKLKALLAPLIQQLVDGKPARRK